MKKRNGINQVSRSSRLLEFATESQWKQLYDDDDNDNDKLQLRKTLKL